MLHFCIFQFICHHSYVILASDSIVKWNHSVLVHWKVFFYWRKHLWQLPSISEVTVMCVYSCGVCCTVCVGLVVLNGDGVSVDFW
jgi:hypothetical protein